MEKQWPINVQESQIENHRAGKTGDCIIMYKWYKNRILWTYIFNLKTIQFHCAVKSKKHRKYSQTQQLFIPV
jgi:hypothetical protein